MLRRSRLRRSAWRRTPNPRNDFKADIVAERKAAEKAKRRQDKAETEGCEYKRWLQDRFRNHGCEICGRYAPPCIIHHVTPRGYCGKAEDQIQICGRCDEDGHRRIGFPVLEKKHGVDLHERAGLLAAEGRELGLLPVDCCGECGEWHSSGLLIDEIDKATGECRKLCEKCSPGGPV